MKRPKGSSGDLEQDMEDRQALIDSSLPQLFDAFDEGIEEGLDDPVLFLLDCEDPIGGPFARAWVGDDEVDLAIQQQRAASPDEDLTVTLAVVFDFIDCQEDMPEYFPYLASTFAEPPQLDGFLTIVISSGGAASFTVPFEVRPNANES